MPQAAIFDIDGTLIDSVDLHAWAWQEAFAHFGHDVSFEQVRGQIGKGGDNLLPVFLSKDELDDHGKALESWRGAHFKANYLPMIRPFAAVPELLGKLRGAGLKIAIASSAKKDELGVYLDIAGVANLVDVSVSSEDADESKPAPDVFEVALGKLGVAAQEAIAIGDAPYDAQAAGKTGVRTIGLLSGAFPEQSLKDAGCIAIFTGPAGLLANLHRSPFAI
ncbi:HAD family hydrolase [Caballeronia fortuita]|uniref:HAD family hydrolase n=1 Tax=Caballeronia fortuita TaxID=1777138 RepID=A0A158DXA8_9BURK|nr:HAD family hydrolase [Caballeronia fortuita]SAK99242.1 HAD family hydrolase [Caballeronia fortuita]